MYAADIIIRQHFQGKKYWQDKGYLFGSAYEILGHNNIL